MKFYKGQIIKVPITFEDGHTQQRYFLVNDRHELLPIIEGYNITTVGELQKRKLQYQTDIPLIPNSTNKLPKPSVVKMNQVFTLDERKTATAFGMLRDDEQKIVDLYEKFYRENGMIQKDDMKNLDEHMRKQYQLFNAVEGNDGVKVEQLISEGASVEEPQLGVTPLDWAVSHGAVSSAASLIRHGAYVDTLGPDEKTPLYHASEKGDKEMVRLLIDAGADPKINAGGKSAVDVATTRQVKELLQENEGERGQNRENQLHRGR